MKVMNVSRGEEGLMIIVHTRHNEPTRLDLIETSEKVTVVKY